MRVFLSSIALAIGLLAGCYVAFHSWQGTYFVSNSKYITLRNPAHVHKLSEFSELKGKAWNLLSRERLMGEAFPIKESERTGLVLGHFITQDSSGKKFFLCDLYNRVQLRFVAEGIMEAGEMTHMTVEAPCRAASDLNRLEPVWIPHVEILKQNPSPSLALDYPANEVKISFSHLTSQWPKQWLLEQVRLVQDGNSAPSMKIDSDEIRRTAKSPIYLNW